MGPSDQDGTDDDPWAGLLIADDDPWLDLEELAIAWSAVWTDGSEVAWLQYAWSRLSEAGLTAYDDEIERAEAVVRLAALVVLYRVFHSYYHQMESVDAWRYDAPDLAGPYPRCDAFSLGQLAHSCDLGIVRVEPADDPLDLPEDAVVEFVTWAAPDVAAALLADLGTEVLFASLYASSRANVAFPLSAELFAEVVEDLSADKLAGHSWVREGLPL